MGNAYINIRLTPLGFIPSLNYRISILDTRKTSRPGLRFFILRNRGFAPAKIINLRFPLNSRANEPNIRGVLAISMA